MIIVGCDYHPGFQQIFGPKVFATTMTNTSWNRSRWLWRYSIRRAIFAERQVSWWLITQRRWS